MLGSMLMVGAHPDDENTGVLAYAARGLKIRTGYLALTRGEGGQNLLGAEQSELLGIIRTQELAAARRVDGAEQFFTRAVDFGYSKSARDSLARWGWDAVLGDVVWVIRCFRPDVIVQVFSGSALDGHGHHQASGIVAREAFKAAADPLRFPEQLGSVEPWQARRLMLSGFKRSTDGPSIEINLKAVDPALGLSYSDIAAMSRSMHRSQGMSHPERRRAGTSAVTLLAGEPVTDGLFDGIDTTWRRVPGGVEAGEVLEKAAREFVPAEPEKTLPLLAEARRLIAGIRDPWAAVKLEELNEAIALCAGLSLEAISLEPAAVPGRPLQVNIEIANRSRLPLLLKELALETSRGGLAVDRATASLPPGSSTRRTLTAMTPEEEPYWQPYWLRRPRSSDFYDIEDEGMIGLAETPPWLRAHCRVEAGAEEIHVTCPVTAGSRDSDGSSPLVAAPPVSVRIAEPVVLFPDDGPRTVNVTISSNAGEVSGELIVETSHGWQIELPSNEFRVTHAGDNLTLPLRIAPPKTEAAAVLRAIACVDGRHVSTETRTIRYPDLQPQTVLLPAIVKVFRSDVRTLAREVGYIVGAGDEVPHALEQMGCRVTLLDPVALARTDLSSFDAIVAGVRAYNVRGELRTERQRLLDYMEAGGTYVVQYNVADGRSPEAVANIGPYPLRLGRHRVSRKDAPVAFLKPDHALLESPNRIGAKDFTGWVQERGLYFATEWDPHYEAVFACHDPEEHPLKGATLYARYGTGVYVFTAFSWFRQLPAGVPGAFRIFANLISAGRAVQPVVRSSGPLSSHNHAR